jgi:hypothetical protein
LFVFYLALIHEAQRAKDLVEGDSDPNLTLPVQENRKIEQPLGPGQLGLTEPEPEASAVKV